MNMIKCDYGNVSEHDMDMVFLQLFSSDRGILDLFLSEAKYMFKVAEVKTIELSKTDPELGESDIVVVAYVDNRLIAILIEDKIDAIAMPDQAERYIKRGDKCVSEGEYDDYLSFIVCPQKYYDGNEEAHKYPCFVSYETVKEYLSTNDSLLYRAYVQLFEQAIDKAKRPSKVTLNEQVNAFFQGYVDYQEYHYPSLNLRSKRESNGYWAHYGTNFGSVYLFHKIQEGKVDLTFNKAATRIDDLSRVADWLRSHNISGARAVATGKGGAIHLDVPKLDMTIPFEDNKEPDVKICFEAIKELVDMANILALAGDLSSL